MTLNPLQKCFASPRNVAKTSEYKQEVKTFGTAFAAKREHSLPLRIPVKSTVTTHDLTTVDCVSWAMSNVQYPNVLVSLQESRDNPLTAAG